MRSMKLAALAIGVLIFGGTLALIAGAGEPSVPSARPTTDITARVTFEIPKSPRYISAMLGIDAASIDAARLTPQGVLARTSIPALAQRIAEDASLENRVPDYFSRFDPDEAEFDRAGLARDLAARISLIAEPASDIITLRVRAESEPLAHALCAFVADTFEHQVRTDRTRHLAQARDAAERMNRTLRTDREALLAQSLNLITNERMESADPQKSSDATTLAIVSERLLDLDLQLAGTAADDPATAEARVKRDWLQVRREELLRETNADMSRLMLLSSIESARESRAQNQFAVERALFLYDEELNAPVINRLEKLPFTESR